MTEITEEVPKDPELANAVFVRMIQALDMLRLVDEHRDNASISAAELYSMFLAKYPEDRDGFYFLNQHFVTGTLFALIVMPKETANAIPETLLSQLDGSWSLEQLEIGVGGSKDTLTLREFVRRLRNSLAHARVRVDNINGPVLKFADGNGEKGTYFCSSLPLGDLIGFGLCLNGWLKTRR